MRCDLGVPNLMIWHNLSRREHSVLPNNVKSNGLWANNVRPCGYACPKETATINPARNSHPPNPDFHRRTPPARRTRTDTPAIPFSRRVNRRPRGAERHAAVERGNGQQVEQPEQGTRAGKPVRAERVRQCGECKAGRRSGEADGGARKRRRRQTAPQDSAAGGQAQGVHRAAGQPNDEKVSAFMYSRRQQENGEHAALIRAPERSHEHKKAVTDLNPAHSVR